MKNQITSINMWESKRIEKVILYTKCYIAWLVPSIHATGKEKQKNVTSVKKSKLLASVAEASSATGTQKAERAELKVNDGGVPMYV